VDPVIVLLLLLLRKQEEDGCTAAAADDVDVPDDVTSANHPWFEVTVDVSVVVPSITSVQEIKGYHHKKQQQQTSSTKQR